MGNREGTGVQETSIGHLPKRCAHHLSVITRVTTPKNLKPGSGVRQKQEDPGTYGPLTHS